MTRYSTISALLYTFQLCFIKILRNDPQRFGKIYKKCKIDLQETQKDEDKTKETQN
jgi:hypothetical protein